MPLRRIASASSRAAPRCSLRSRRITAGCWWISLKSWVCAIAGSTACLPQARDQTPHVLREPVDVGLDVGGDVLVGIPDEGREIHAAGGPARPGHAVRLEVGRVRPPAPHGREGVALAPPDLRAEDAQERHLEVL